MQLNNSMARDLTQGSVLKQLITFSLPIIAANMLQIVYTMADIMIIGRFIGSAGISAVSAGGDVLFFFTTFSMGFCGAGQVVISQFQGRGDSASVSRSVGTMFTFVLLFALALTIVAIPLTGWMLNVLNTPDEAWLMASDYATVCFLGLFFIFGYNAVSAMLRGMGDSVRPLLFISISTIINIILDIIFVGMLDLRAFGAALATVIAQGLSFIASVTYLYKRRASFGFDFKIKSFRPDAAILKMLLRLGLPMALQQTIVSISSMYVSSLVNSYGVKVSSLSGIGNKLRMIIGIFSSSIGTAASTMIGQNIGAGKIDRVKRTYLLSLLILLVMCAGLGLVGVLFPRTVIGLFDRDPAVLAMAPRFMVINLVLYVAFAFYVPVTSLINGIGYASLAFALGIVDGVVARIGLVNLLGRVLNYGIWGIWWGAALAAYVVAVIGTIYFLSGRWKKRRIITHQEET